MATTCLCFSGLHFDVLTFLMLFGGSVFSGVCWSFVADMGNQTTQILPPHRFSVLELGFPAPFRALLCLLLVFCCLYPWLTACLSSSHPRSCLSSLSFSLAQWSLLFKSHRYIRYFSMHSVGGLLPLAVSEGSLFSCLLYLSA